MNLSIRTITAALLAACTLLPARAQIPSILNYQGRVTVGGTNLTTNAAQFKFALVEGNGGTVYWRNDGSTVAGEPSTAVPVTVAQGLYSTLLGDTMLSNMAAIPNSVFTNENVNLRVWFSAGGTNPFVQVTPDQRLGASAYALRAAVADNIALTNIDSSFSIAGTLTVGKLIGGSGNTASALNAVVAGGTSNSASAQYATIGGGVGNTIPEQWIDNSDANNPITNLVQNATIVGGIGNLNIGIGGFIGGGSFNVIEPGDYSSIAGGYFNKTRGYGATVPGGALNEAFRDDTFAAGVQAKATNVGSFVWSGTYGTDTVSTNDYSFTVRAPGGVRFITSTNTDGLEILGIGGANGVAVAPGGTAWVTLSDRNAKTEIKDIDSRAVLAKLGRLPVTEWEYKHDPQRRYFGPMAQDFHAAFGLGADDKTINTLDADGVLFLSVKGLLEELKERDKVIQELKTKLETVEERLDSLPPAP